MKSVFILLLKFGSCSSCRSLSCSILKYNTLLSLNLTFTSSEFHFVNFFALVSNCIPHEGSHFHSLLHPPIVLFLTSNVALYISSRSSLTIFWVDLSSIKVFSNSNSSSAQKIHVISLSSPLLATITVGVHDYEYTWQMSCINN
jgi:hypothetical protein